MIESLLVIVVIVLIFNWRIIFSAPNRTSRTDHFTSGYVEQVVDGDTIRVRVDGVLQTVRYIGMNTPERGEPGYEEAKRYNQRLVSFQRVLMEADRRDEDPYGRKLRYVWVRGWLSGYFVNQAMVRAGLAKVKVIEPNTKRIWEIQS